MRLVLKMPSLPQIQDSLSAIESVDLGKLHFGPLDAMLDQIHNSAADDWVHFGICTQGSAKILLPEVGTRVVTEGNWFILADHGVNSSLQISKDTEGWLVSVPNKLVKTVLQQQKQIPDSLVCLNCNQRSASFFVSGYLTPRLSNIAEDLLGKSLSTVGTKFIRLAKSFELVARVFEQPEFTRPASCRKLIANSNVESIKKVATYLEANLQGNHSLQSLCKHCYINEFKLKKGFKEHFGTTVFGYLRSKRMQQAKTLLSESENNVLDVANSVGYSNASHFTRAFREEFGINPREFKESLMQA